MLNFLLDMMLLFLTQALARENIRKKRIIFGAMVASLIVPLSFYFPESFLTSTAGKLMYSILIIYCSFGYKSFHRMVKLLFLFYFISFSIGGGLIAIHFLFQQPVSITDRKSTRLNSSHVASSYAVFCLKNKQRIRC